MILLGVDLSIAAQAPVPPPTPKPGSYEAEGRPGFVLFDNADSMPWEDLNIPGMPDGIKARVLSRSPSMGAVSLMTYLPIGWHQDNKGYHNSDVEIFLLEGDLTIRDAKGEQKLTKYSYTYIPAGTAYGPVSTQQGAVLIHWFKGKPDFVASNRDKQGARAYAAVRDWNYYRKSLYIGEPFPAYRVGGNIPGSIHELLRQDPDTGEMTWMVFSAGGGGGPAPAISTYEIHPASRNTIGWNRVDATRLANAFRKDRHPFNMATAATGGGQAGWVTWGRCRTASQAIHSPWCAPVLSCGRTIPPTARTSRRS